VFRGQHPQVAVVSAGFHTVFETADPVDAADEQAAGEHGNGAHAALVIGTAETPGLGAPHFGQSRGHDEQEAVDHQGQIHQDRGNTGAGPDRNQFHQRCGPADEGKTTDRSEGTDEETNSRGEATPSDAHSEVRPGSIELKQDSHSRENGEGHRDRQNRHPASWRNLGPRNSGHRDDQGDEKTPGGWDQQGNHQEARSEEHLFPGVAMPPAVGEGDVAQMRMKMDMAADFGALSGLLLTPSAEAVDDPAEDGDAGGALCGKEPALRGVARSPNRSGEPVIAGTKSEDGAFGLIISPQLCTTAIQQKHSADEHSQDPKHGEGAGQPSGLLGIGSSFSEAEHLAFRKGAQQSHGEHPFGDGNGDLSDEEDTDEFEKGGHVPALRRRISDRELDSRGDVRGQIADHSGKEDRTVAASAGLHHEMQHEPHRPRAGNTEREEICAERGQSAMGQQQGLENQRDESQRRHRAGTEKIRAHRCAHRMRRTAGDGRHPEGTQSEQEGCRRS
jgi:hypothetical protein